MIACFQKQRGLVDKTTADLLINYSGRSGLLITLRREMLITLRREKLLINRW